MPLRVGDHREIQAAVLALKAADRDLRSDINRATTAMLNPVWREAVSGRAVTAVDRAVIAKGARVSAGNPPTAYAATSTKALRGGLVPAVQWPVIEFGAIARNKVTTYTGRRGSRHFTVRRHASRQLPARDKSGRVAYAALAEVTPRVVSLWVQLIVRKYAEALGVSRG